MKTRLLVIALILLFVAGIAWLVLPDAPDNGFKRNWKPRQLKLENERVLLDKIQFAFSPAYTSDGQIWLKKRQKPLELFRLNARLTDLNDHKIAVARGFDTARVNYYFNRLDGGFLVTNERGQLSLTHGGKNILYRVRLKFDNPVFLSANSVIVRAFTREKDEQRLKLVKLNLGDSVRICSSFLIPKQVDGAFCSDGQLQFDRTKDRLFYMFYYRGQFLCLDTGLNQVYKAKTIDTVTRANIRVQYYTKRLGNGKTAPRMTLNTPGSPVNKYFSADEDRVYIRAGLRADNQKNSEFLRNVTIDVYDAKNGSYLNSFMVAPAGGKTFRQFQISGNQLLGINGGELFRYRLLN